jgi:hypothetical protein
MSDHPHSCTFKLPVFDVQHNEVLIDVYKNDLFERRLSKPRNTDIITINNVKYEESIYVKAYPCNRGSIYNKNCYTSESKFFELGDNKEVSQQEAEVSPPAVRACRVVFPRNNPTKDSIRVRCVYENLCGRIHYSVVNSNGDHILDGDTSKVHDFTINNLKIKNGILSITPYYNNTAGEEYTIKF